MEYILKRYISFIELQQARHPSMILCYHMNLMHSNFHPMTNYDIFVRPMDKMLEIEFRLTTEAEPQP